MSITPQIQGQALAQPAQSFIDTNPKTPNFGSGFNERVGLVAPGKAFTNYFGRVHKKYNMDTTNIENLANRLLRAKDSNLMNFVREETLLKDTFSNRFVEAKTPLGQVLQELQNSQESPNRKLLSKGIFNEAEKEAQGIIQKRVIPVGKIGTEFLVNSYTANNQRRPSAISLNNDKFFVAWSSDGQDGDGDGIYGQIFNADGAKSGSEFQINSYTANDQGNPSAAFLNNGKFVVTWTSIGQDGDGAGIYGQIFNADGTKSGTEFQVNTYVANNQYISSTAGLNNDKFVVTWTSEGQDGSGYGIYGQIFNADGTKNGTEFPVNTFTSLHQQRPSVASLSNGKFIVVWDSILPDNSTYGQLFNADGTKSGSEFQINTFPTLMQIAPSAASLNNGKFIVTWTSGDILSSQDGSQFGVYGQLFNADGSKSGSEFQVNSYTLWGQVYPDVTSFTNDKFVITWTSYQDGSGNGVYGQLFNADGTKSGSEFQVNSYTTDNQKFSSAKTLGNDNFVITWESSGQDGNGTGIYGQIFGTDITGVSESSTTSTSSITVEPISLPSIMSSRQGTDSSLSAGITDSTKPKTRQTGYNTAVVSGAERQISSIALTSVTWLFATIKDFLGN